jgi:hypothetical protein
MYTAFGLAIASELELPGLRAAGTHEPTLTIRLATDVMARTGFTPVWRSRFSDGCVVTAEASDAGEQRLIYGDRSSFLIAADAGTISCDARDHDDPSWRRFLLDTVLWWTCLTRGMEALHGSAIALEGGVHVLAGGTGAGKTSLAAELMRRGNELFSDDVVLFDRRDGALVAQPGPPLMNVPFGAGDTAELGTPLARFDDQGETWVAVHRSAADPAPIAGIVLLERADGLPLALERIDATVLDLMPHVWGLPHAAETAKDRFDAVSDIARAVPVARLTAGLDAPPAALAAFLDDALATAEGAARA